MRQDGHVALAKISSGGVATLRYVLGGVAGEMPVEMRDKLHAPGATQ